MRRELESTGVQFIVASTAQNDKILPHVGAAPGMVLDVMQFQNTRVGSGPAFDVPTAKTTGVIVALVHLALYRIGNAAIVRLRNARGGLEDVLSGRKVGTACEACCDLPTVFRAKLASTAAELSRFGDVCKFLGCDDFANILL